MGTTSSEIRESDREEKSVLPPFHILTEGSDRDFITLLKSLIDRKGCILYLDTHIKRSSDTSFDVSIPTNTKDLSKIVLDSISFKIDILNSPKSEVDAFVETIPPGGEGTKKAYIQSSCGLDIGTVSARIVIQCDKYTNVYKILMKEGILCVKDGVPSIVKK